MSGNRARNVGDQERAQRLYLNVRVSPNDHFKFSTSSQCRTELPVFGTSSCHPSIIRRIPSTSRRSFCCFQWMSRDLVSKRCPHFVLAITTQIWTCFVKVVTRTSSILYRTVCKLQIESGSTCRIGSFSRITSSKRAWYMFAHAIRMFSFKQHRPLDHSPTSKQYL